MEEGGLESEWVDGKGVDGREWVDGNDGLMEGWVDEGLVDGKVG